MPSAGFEPASPAIDKQQTYALDSTTIGMGSPIYVVPKRPLPKTKQRCITSQKSQYLKYKAAEAQNLADVRTSEIYRLVRHPIVNYGHTLCPI